MLPVGFLFDNGKEVRKLSNDERLQKIVVQPCYNSLIMYNSLSYRISHMWNQLPTITKSSTTLEQF